MDMGGRGMSGFRWTMEMARTRCGGWTIEKALEPGNGTFRREPWPGPGSSETALPADSAIGWALEPGDPPLVFHDPGNERLCGVQELVSSGRKEAFLFVFPRRERLRTEAQPEPLKAADIDNAKVFAGIKTDAIAVEFDESVLPSHLVTAAALAAPTFAPRNPLQTSV